LKSNILITGVAGFIGSNLADYLLKKKYNIIGIDNLSYGLVDQVPKDIKFFNTDIRSKKIYKIFNNIDIVFHLAAKNCISDCQLDPVETADINITGTVNIFEACKRAGVKKVIYAESSALYENSSVFPTTENDINPKSFYSISKYADKFFAEAYESFYDLETIALRYFNVYGPKQDYRRSIPPLMCELIIKLLKGEQPTIYGNGAKRRDFIYVDDVNKFHEMLIKNSSKQHRTFNIGTGINYSVLEVFEIIQSLINTNVMPKHKPDLEGEAFQNLADISNARSLGWKPKVNLEEGLKLSIDYIQKNVL